METTNCPILFYLSLNRSNWDRFMSDKIHIKMNSVEREVSSRSERRRRVPVKLEIFCLKSLLLNEITFQNSSYKTSIYIQSIKTTALCFHSNMEIRRVLFHKFEENKIIRSEIRNNTQIFYLFSNCWIGYGLNKLLWSGYQKNL